MLLRGVRPPTRGVRPLPHILIKINPTRSVYSFFSLWAEHNNASTVDWKRKLRDQNIPWPPRSPDLTHPWIFFIWGFIKSKVYVRNYESLEELKVSIAAAFRELTPAMVTSTLKNMEKRLRKIDQREGGHIEK